MLPEIEEYTDANTFLDLTIETLCAFYLKNHNIQKVSYKNFNFYDNAELNNFVELIPTINKISQKYFTIDSSNIYISQSFIETVKTYLYRRLISIIDPRRKIYSEMPVKILGDVNIRENYPPIDKRKMGKNLIYTAYVQRYITHACYPSATLNLLDNIINKLLTMTIKTIPRPDCKYVNKFYNALNYTIFWKKVASNLLNGTLKENDEITDYIYLAEKCYYLRDYYNKVARNLLDNIEWINSTTIPSIIKTKNEKILITSTFFENPLTIIPYILDKIEFGYAPKKIIKTLIYSSLL